MELENHNPTILAPRDGHEPLTEVDAASRLGLKVATLRAWRHQRRGPAFVRLGRSIRYLASDLEAFMYAHRETPGSRTSTTDL